MDNSVYSALVTFDHNCVQSKHLNKTIVLKFPGASGAVFVWLVTFSWSQSVVLTEAIFEFAMISPEKSISICLVHNFTFSFGTTSGKYCLDFKFKLLKILFLSGAQ